MKTCPMCRSSQVRLTIRNEATFELNDRGQLPRTKAKLVGGSISLPGDVDPANCKASCPSCKKEFPVEATKSGIIRVRKPRVFVCLVTWAGASPTTDFNLMEAVMHQGRRFCECCAESSGFIVGRGKSQASLLPVARTNAAKIALKTDCEFVLFIDQDTTEFDADAILRMAYHNLPVVSAYICRRSPPFDPVHKYMGDKGEIQSPCITDDEIDKLARGHVQECWGVGMAFTLIRRDVLEAVGEPYFRFIPANYNEEDKSSGWFNGEDHSFCILARERGFKSYVDCGVHLGHERSVSTHIKDWVEYCTRDQEG